MEFYEMIGRHYDTLFPPSEPQKEFLKKQLDELDGEGRPLKILDLGCATGGYALYVAQLGHQVTAVDLDTAMIEILTRSVKEGMTQEGSSLAVQAYADDLRALESYGENYDLIYCIGNTLVHLDSLTEVRSFVQSAYKMLKPGGRLIIQSVNYDRVLKENIQRLPEIHREEPELHFIRTYKHVPGAIEFVGQLTDETGKTWDSKTKLLPILKDDLKKAFILSGFSEIGIYGDFTEKPFSFESPALVTMAVK